MAFFLRRLLRKNLESFFQSIIWNRIRASDIAEKNRVARGFADRD